MDQSRGWRSRLGSSGPDMNTSVFPVGGVEACLGSSGPDTNTSVFPVGCCCASCLGFVCIGLFLTIQALHPCL